jgi:uncharacterized protein YuzE
MAEHDKMKKKVSYDRRNDILSIHSGFSKDERFRGNIDAGDLILDVSTKKRVRGIEILDASSFLKEFGITEESLSEMTDAEFSAQMRPEGISIGLLIKSKYNQAGIPAKILAVRETAY